jgi:hypothetical protein
VPSHSLGFRVQRLGFREREHVHSSASLSSSSLYTCIHTIQTYTDVLYIIHIIYLYIYSTHHVVVIQAGLGMFRF